MELQLFETMQNAEWTMDSVYKSGASSRQLPPGTKERPKTRHMISPPARTPSSNSLAPTNSLSVPRLFLLHPAGHQTV